MTSLAIVLSIALAFSFGFAAQRGGLCAVSAIRTLIEDETFGPWLSFLRCSAWVIVVSLPVWWLCPAARVSKVYAFGLAGLAGAAVFGLGAAVNGACNFGTLTRFATGDVSFAMTVLGAALGVWIGEEAFETRIAGPIGPTILAHPGVGAVTLFAVVALWCVIGLVAPGKEGGSRRSAHVAPMVVGLTGGGLYLINGGWAYTLNVSRLVSASALGEISDHALLVITAATGAGAVAAAWTSGSFRLRLNIAVLPHRLGGGTLMGFGAVLVPGGNAVLVLHGIPAFSPHAVPDYLALCLGISVMLLMLRRLRTLARFPAMRRGSVHKVHTWRIKP
jgi:uncharacterized protein